MVDPGRGFRAAGTVIPALRPYQQEGIAAVRSAFSAVRRVLYVLPTGGGKTFVFSVIAQAALNRGRRVAILVHRQELLAQASSSLNALGVAHGLIAPGHPRTQHPVQVASVQALDRRIRKGFYPFDLLIVDEAHHAVAGTWRRVVAAYPDAHVLGVTATPCRTDGAGLSEAFDAMVLGPSIADLIDAGYLCRPIVYAPPSAVDLSGVRMRGGDYETGALAAAVDRPTITGDAVAHYRRLADRQPAIAFCASVKHAQHVAAEFIAAGYAAVSLDGTMHDGARRDAIEGLASGRYHVLTSCDIVSEGTDIPAVSAAILLRPTQSLSLYIQQVGRVLRPAAGKQHALILDHVGNTLRHGLPQDAREWSLAGSKRAAAARDTGPAVSQCGRCYAVFRPSAVCPECGHVRSAPGREIAHADGELQQIDAEAIKRAQARQQQGRARTLQELLEVARQRGYSARWAHHVYRARRRQAA